MDQIEMAVLLFIGCNQGSDRGEFQLIFRNMYPEQHMIMIKGHIPIGIKANANHEKIGKQHNQKHHHEQYIACFQ